MEYGKTVELISVKEKLKKLEKEFGGRDTCITWITVPYSESNLKIVEESLKELNWNTEEYRLSYDENIIFIDKELF